jgi:hypothetical protein
MQIEKPKGRNQLGKHRCKLEKKWGGMVRIDLAQGPVPASCENGNEPSGSIKCLLLLLNYGVGERLAAAQERLSPVELSDRTL